MKGSINLGAVFWESTSVRIFNMFGLILGPPSIYADPQLDMIICMYNRYKMNTTQSVECYAEHVWHMVPA